MIHVTEMGRGYVGSPSEIVSVGDQVEVRVKEVDPRRGRISLSMKDLPTEHLDVYDDEEEDMPSSMELALREAMDQEGVTFTERDSGRRRKKPKRRRDRDQDDIIFRTLRSHQN
jgi:predicted RNA-binding protein with RPS1 domain